MYKTPLQFRPYRADYSIFVPS